MEPGWGIVCVCACAAALAGWGLARWRRAPRRPDVWRCAVEGAGDGVWDYDVASGRVFYSRQWKAMLGFAEHEIGDSIAEWQSRVHPDDLDAALAAVRRHLDGRDDGYRSEHRLRCKDGSWKWILDRGRVVERAADGRALRVVGTHNDISEQRRLQAEVQHARNELAITFERMTDNIVSLDRDLRYLWLNRIALQRLHKDRGELVGRCLLEVFPEVIGSEFERRYRLALETQQPDEFEAEFKPFGIWLHMRIYPAPSGLTLFYYDITERKRTEHRLDDQHAFLQRLIETVPIPICHKDASGIIRGCNPAFLAFQGATPDQVVGLPAPVVFPPAAVDEVRRQDAALLAHGGRQEFQMTVPVVSGGTREVLLIKAAYLHADGSVAGLLVFIVDLTERIRGERALRLALDQAQAASVAKSQFLATMSHEIRTPLNGVIGMTDVLMQSGLAPEQQAMAGIVRDCGHGLLAVIGDVLDLAKIESGSLRIERGDFAPRRLLGELQALFAASARAKGLELLVHVDPALPEQVHGDAQRLHQVLMNLLGNAVKFTAAGQVELSVRVAGSGPAGLRLACTVRDTGPGIPAAYLPRIFEPFSQADGTSSRRHGGTGLGLAIAKRLTDLMGGTLEVETALGHGTSFTLAVPLGHAAPGAAAEPDAMPPPAVERQPAVLVVEDDPICQLTIRAMLGELGCTHRLAADGEQAVAAVGEAAFDLVLMDCQMPVCDGYTATARIRERLRDAPRRLAIVALTANAFTEDRDRCLAAGMDGFLTKPCTLQALRDCLARWARPG